MHSFAIVVIASLLLVALAAACIARALRRRGDVGVQCFLELTPQDGWRLLNLAIVSRHDMKVWVEQAAFVVTELNANMQSGPAGCLGSVEIREFIRPGEDLLVSLIEPVYNAAGKPQGVYSFGFHCTVHYRLGERWLESESPAFRVEMVRLSATRIRRVSPLAAARARAGTSTAQPLPLKNEVLGGEESRRSAAETESFNALLGS